MTPNDIGVLLHYHVFSAPHPRFNTPEVRDTILWFLNENIFVDTKGQTFALTPRGIALVKILCRTKFPTATWADEHGVAV